MKNIDLFIQDIAKKAGSIILSYYKKVKPEYKGKDKKETVTKADIESNKFLLAKIREKYPEHGIISEELPDYNRTAEYIWTIDPLDGTNNFVNEIPLFCVLISLYKNKKPISGVIYNPVEKVLLFAKTGKGLFANGKRAYCSKTEDFPYSYGIVDGRPFGDYSHVFKKVIDASKKQCLKISMYRSIGVSASYVARGYRDWLICAGANIWDYAPSAVVLKEAGCRIGSITGKEWQMGDKELVASGPKIYSEFSKILK
jgi:myo-inositol-1(or 4)-monophosphatase